MFISPSNSLGFMDGGIDYAYSRIMFPHIEQKVKAKIKELSMQTALGRFYLPIGSAIAVNHESSWLICAPTMFLPHDVFTTRNAYHAFMAALCMFDKLSKKYPELKTLVCPALCTGYGKMPIEEAVKQMHEAYQEYMNHNIPKQLRNIEYAYITESKDEEQPNNYDNREIKIIKIF